MPSDTPQAPPDFQTMTPEARAWHVTTYLAQLYENQRHRDRLEAEARRLRHLVGQAAGILERTVLVNADAGICARLDSTHGPTTIEFFTVANEGDLAAAIAEEE